MANLNEEKQFIDKLLNEEMNPSFKEPKIFPTTLTDGSEVFGVEFFGAKFDCVDEKAAMRVANALVRIADDIVDIS